MSTSKNTKTSRIIWKLMRDRKFLSKDKTAHYDIDGVSFESSTGVIIAGCKKSSQRKPLKPARDNS